MQVLLYMHITPVNDFHFLKMLKTTCIYLVMVYVLIKIYFLIFSFYLLLAIAFLGGGGGL